MSLNNNSDTEHPCRVIIKRLNFFALCELIGKWIRGFFGPHLSLRLRAYWQSDKLFTPIRIRRVGVIKSQETNGLIILFIFPFDYNVLFLYRPSHDVL